MKIAVLFRGPLRPNSESVVARVNEFLWQFNKRGIRLDTYLSTWRDYRGQKAADLIGMDLFDNVIMQTPPSDERIRKFVKVKQLENTADITYPFYMYYQSKTAIDLIHNADDYDYIIHTRTDMRMIIDSYINEWFIPDTYVAIHTHRKPFTTESDAWMNDQFGIAPAHIMQQAWDYGTLENLGRMFDNADIPDRILQRLIDSKGIKFKSAQYNEWILDPQRSE
jgi:hypothetical protein